MKEGGSGDGHVRAPGHLGHPILQTLVEIERKDSIENNFEKKGARGARVPKGARPGFGLLGVLDGPFFHILHRPPPSLP